MSDELGGLDATAQAELVARREITPAELVEAAIQRLERYNPALNAVTHSMVEKAREQAAGELADGPFRGVPFLIKDLDIRCAGAPIGAGMRLLRQHRVVQEQDSFLMMRYRAAGLVALGRTNTPELGILPTTEPAAFGPTRNPWDPTRSPGGSSGGSAAAVAAGIVPIAHATDGGGSIRIPASACGLVGLKPTRARISKGPQVGDVRGGLVCEHVVARSVRDTATMLDWCAGAQPGDPYAAPPPNAPYRVEIGAAPRPLRIGYTVEFVVPDGGLESAHPSCVAAVEHAVELLRRLGHHCVPGYPEALTDELYVPKFLTIWASGVAQDIAEWETATGVEIGEGDVEPLTFALCQMGRQTSAVAYLEAWRWLQGNCRRLASWWHDGGYDLYLTPTLAEPPLPLGSFDAPPGAGIMTILRAATYVPFTPPFNVSGQPAISLPLHQDEDGLPIGCQFVAPYAREDLLLRLAAQLERELGGWRFPAL